MAELKVTHWYGKAAGVQFEYFSLWFTIRV